MPVPVRASLAVADLPYVDVTAPGFTWDDPVVEAAREECWAARTPLGVVTLRYAETAQLLHDPRLRNDFPRTLLPPAGATGERGYNWSGWMLYRNGQEHRRLRRPVIPPLDLRRITGLRPFIRTTAQQLTKDLTKRLTTGDGVCDFVEAFADQLPLTVMHHLLGTPPGADAGFDPSWTHEVELGLGWDPDLRLRAKEATARLSDYASTLITQCRANPGDGMLSALLHARQKGMLDEDELRMTVVGLLAAGHDTPSCQLGLAMAALAQHPDQWRLLQQRPQLVEQAVEGVLRFTPAVPVMTWKAAVVDIDHHGVRIPSGTVVWLGVHAAHRDPRAFPHPATFDITTEHTKPPLAFSGGPHTCAGAALARLELAEALTALTTRLGPPQIARPITNRPPFGSTGPQTLPLRFGDTASAVQGAPPQRTARPGAAPVVRRADLGDLEEVAAILTAAFADNPLTAWVYDTPEQYHRLAPAYFRWATQRALHKGVGYLVEGKAAWLGLPSTTLETTPERMRAAHQQLRDIGAERAEQLLAYEDALLLHHPTRTPHWYGMLIGVHPAFAGQHIGWHLLHHVISEHNEMPYYGEVLPRIATWHEQTFAGFTRMGSYKISNFTLIQIWRNPGHPISRRNE